MMDSVSPAKPSRPVTCLVCGKACTDHNSLRRISRDKQLQLDMLRYLHIRAACGHACRGCVLRLASLVHKHRRMRALCHHTLHSIMGTASTVAAAKAPAKLIINLPNVSFSSETSNAGPNVCIQQKCLPSFQASKVQKDALADHCYADGMRLQAETAARGKAVHKATNEATHTAQEQQLAQQESADQEKCMEFTLDKTKVATDYVNANPIPSERTKQVKRTSEDNDKEHTVSLANRFQSKHRTPMTSELAGKKFHSNSIPQSNPVCSISSSQRQVTYQSSRGNSTVKHKLPAPNVLVFCSSSNPSQNPVVTAVPSPASVEQTRVAHSTTQKPLHAACTVPSSLPAPQTLHPKPTAAPTLLPAPTPAPAPASAPPPAGPAFLRPPGEFVSLEAQMTALGRELHAFAHGGGGGRLQHEGELSAMQVSVLSAAVASRDVTTIASQVMAVPALRNAVMLRAAADVHTTAAHAQRKHGAVSLLLRKDVDVGTVGEADVVADFAHHHPLLFHVVTAAMLAPVSMGTQWRQKQLLKPLAAVYGIIMQTNNPEKSLMQQILTRKLYAAAGPNMPRRKAVLQLLAAYRLTLSYSSSLLKPQLRFPPAPASAPRAPGSELLAR